MNDLEKSIQTQEVPSSGTSHIRVPPLKQAQTGESKSQNGSRPFPDVKPHPEPVDPAAVLDAVVTLIRRHVVLDHAYAIAVALWIAMTWFIDAVGVAPLLIITAPEKACGKSQLLAILHRLVCRPLTAANTTASFLFRAIEAWMPTILIDEADTFIRENVELKGLINAGHTRDSAFVGRTVTTENDFEPRMFNVWGPKALAGIALERHLSDATMSRGIIATLRRKLANEIIVRLRHADRAEFELLAAKLARLAQDYAEQVHRARPVLPDELSDRAQDNWEPLLAIAECAGPKWLEMATHAALFLSQSTEESASTGNELLEDIQEIFASKKISKISSADLIAALVEDAEKPWATYNRGKSLTPRQLAKQLAAYGIKSKTVRLGPRDTPKGFDIEQFQDAFARYLTGSTQAASGNEISGNTTPDTCSGEAEKSSQEKHFDKLLQVF